MAKTLIMTDEGGLAILEALDAATSSTYALTLCSNNSLSDGMVEADLDPIVLTSPDDNTSGLGMPTISLVGGIPTMTWADVTFDFTGPATGTELSIHSIMCVMTIGATDSLLFVDHITTFTPDTGASLVVKPSFQLGCGDPQASMV